MIKNLLTAGFLLSSSLVLAQRKFEIGIEGAVTNARYRFNDPADNLRPVAAISGMGGISFRYNLSNKFFIESAALTTEYGEGMKLKQQLSSGYSSGDVVTFVAFRTGIYIPVSKCLSIVPLAGVVPGMKLEDADGTTSLTSFPGGTNYTYTTRQLNRNFLLLLQGGLGFELSLIKNIKAALSVNHYQGLRIIKIFDVQYQVDGGPVQQATVEGKGSQLTYQLSLRYCYRCK